MLFSEFKKKEVINLKNCQKLGRVADFEFDECTGQIYKLIVPGNNKLYGLFCNDPDYDIRPYLLNIFITDYIIRVITK